MGGIDPYPPGTAAAGLAPMAPFVVEPADRLEDGAGILPEAAAPHVVAPASQLKAPGVPDPSELDAVLQRFPGLQQELITVQDHVVVDGGKERAVDTGGVDDAAI